MPTKEEMIDSVLDLKKKLKNITEDNNFLRKQNVELRHMAQDSGSEKAVIEHELIRLKDKCTCQDRGE